MKAFLSHSSADKAFVISVYDALAPGSTWLDRAEIEWGSKFLDKIEEGIEASTDFVLFWSKAAADSAWVAFEMHMAFMELLNRRAIRFRVIRLDDTPLPLRLEPFHFLSVADSEDPLSTVVSELRTALNQPSHGVRHRFLNRNSELARIEDLINEPDTRVVVLQGFQGIGKQSLASESLRRFFDNASVVDITVTPGVGPTELALQLHHHAFGTVLPEVYGKEALAAVEAAFDAIVSRGQFIILRNTQHWLDGERNLEEPLPTILRQATLSDITSRNPVFLTTTRMPRIPSDISSFVSLIRVQGLAPSHMASLVALWYESSQGSDLDAEHASRVAAELHGHPVAAKMAAILISQFGVEHILEYPRELTSLRRDLTKTLMNDLRLSEGARRLLETLAVIGNPVPAKVLVGALRTDTDAFQNAVADATSTGLTETTDVGHLAIHPLVGDYFWRSHLDRADYREQAGAAAAAVRAHLDDMPNDSAAFVRLLPSVVRLYALSDNLQAALSMRRDLVGELAQAAITHYNRRNLHLAEAFIQEVLAVDPQNWRMRQYLARVRIRQRRWRDADNLIGPLSIERPQDVGVKHLRGWRLLRERRYPEALSVFIEVLVEREHVASLRDGAECLYRLGRGSEALDFLGRAKVVESDNPYVLELESRIYEEAGDYEEALRAANLAVNRNPGAWGLRHRRALILKELGRHTQAIAEAEHAVDIGVEQFTPRSTLVSLLLDAGLQDRAVPHLGTLDGLSVNDHERQIATHLRARAEHLAGNLDAALAIVERQIGRGVNLAPSYGLLVQIRLAQYTRLPDRSTASAAVLLQQAKTALQNCEAQPTHDANIVMELRSRIASLDTASGQL